MGRILDVEQACHAVRRCNASAAFGGAERLMHQHFRTLGDALDARTIPERVVLVDQVWATQMFWKQGLVERVIHSLQRDADRLLALLATLSSDALEHSPDDVIQAAHEALPSVMGLADVASHGGPYSFGTKFVHWTTRVHFPIIDTRARRAVSGLQRSHSMTPRIPGESGVLPWRDDYTRWITFYSELLRSLSSGERELLKQTDTDSQPRALRCENTLLRILDKVFYTLGGDRLGTGTPGREAERPRTTTVVRS